jgi:hypothetical protein
LLWVLKWKDVTRNQLQGLAPRVKERMCVAYETITDITQSVMSTLHFCEHYFNTFAPANDIPHPFLILKKISQDTLENYFREQRQRRGGTHAVTARDYESSQRSIVQMKVMKIKKGGRANKRNPMQNIGQ